MNYVDYMAEIADHIFDNDLILSEATVQVNKIYIFRDNLMTKVSKAMNAAGIKKVIDFTGKFLADHTKQLYTSGPVYNFTFIGKDTQFFYDLFGITKNELLKLFNETVEQTYTNVTTTLDFKAILSAPHKLLLAALTIWAFNANNIPITECCEYLVVFAEYPMIFHKYWPTAPPREDIMNSVVDNLGNKNILKQQKNLRNWLKHHGETCIKNYRARLTGDNIPDHLYMDFINRVRTQLNSAFKNIARMYNKFYEQNASQHVIDSKLDDGTVRIQKSSSTTIGQLAEATHMKFTTNKVNETVIHDMATVVGVSSSKLNTYVSTILNTSEKEIKLYKFIETVIMLFFQSKPADDKLGSAIFLSFGMALYRSIGTSKDPPKVFINDLLKHWVIDILELDKTTDRVASIISYRRAIYNYMIYMIQLYN